MSLCSKFHLITDPCKLLFHDHMQQGNNVGGLSGLWAPVDGKAAAGTRQANTSGLAERDPMHEDQSAGGAQKGRSRADGEAGIGSAMTCVAHAPLGAQQPNRGTRASGSDRHACFRSGDVFACLDIAGATARRRCFRNRQHAPCKLRRLCRHSGPGGRRAYTGRRSVGRQRARVQRSQAELAVREQSHRGWQSSHSCRKQHTA